MFEKEAEEYNQKVPFNPLNVEKEIRRAFQKGAEFGYNKAKEWHYPSKGELPEKTGRFLILNRFGEHYFTTNVTEYSDDTKMFSCFSMETVYAWKEIVPPKLEG